MNKMLIRITIMILWVSKSATTYAFNLKTAFTPACHEEMVAAALRRATWPKDVEDGPPTRAEGVALDALGLTDMLPFETSQTVALTLGVRDPDLRGHAIDDLLGLAGVHADPKRQMEHCLRASDQDGEEGNALALASCQAHIMNMLGEALGKGEEVDGQRRVSVEVALPYEGTVTLRPRSFGFYVGRAMHALEDSFSHSFRSPDGHRVRHVLNYVDWAKGQGVASRDGEPHASVMDLCDGETAGGVRRVAWAKVASRQLLDAVLDPQGGRAGRLRRAEKVLDGWLRLERGCTAENRYCDAPELDECEGCAVAGGGSLLGIFPVLVLFVLLLVMRRRRRQGSRFFIALPLILAIHLFGGGAAVAAKDDRCHHDSSLLDSTRPGRVSILSTIGASLDKGGFSGALGVRVAVHSRLSLGLTAELNPWHAIEIPDVEWGTFNLYASGSFRWISLHRLTLTTSAHVGMSVLLFDLVSAERGSTGLFFGLSFLGIRYQLSKRLHLVVEPAEVAVPIPQLTGIPLVYVQYRMTLGLLIVLN